MATGGKLVLFIGTVLVLLLLTGAVLWGIGNCLRREEVRLYCILSYKDSLHKVLLCMYAQEVILRILHEFNNTLRAVHVLCCNTR